MVSRLILLSSCIGVFMCLIEFLNSCFITIARFISNPKDISCMIPFNCFLDFLILGCLILAWFMMNNWKQLFRNFQFFRYFFLYKFPVPFHSVCNIFFMITCYIMNLSIGTML